MYLIDSDVLIQAKNLHYAFDFCPAFWDWVERGHEGRLVASVDAVYREVEGAKDELSAWAKANRGFFFRADKEVLAELQRASAWAVANYTEPGPTAFLSAADSYLVAHAAAYKHTVVTQERPANSPTKIKIPDACAALGVPCVNVFTMLRTEGARFVL